MNTDHLHPLARRAALAASCAAVLAVFAGCGDAQTGQPVSLKTPRAIALARGPVCLRSVGNGENGVVHADITACPDGQRGAMGLVANQDDDSVSVIDMARRGGEETTRPRLVDLNTGIPGVTGISVGKSPTDIAAGHTATAYALNQADASVSVIDLWNLLALPWTIDFDSAPTKLLLTPADEGAEEADPGVLAVALSRPARLWLHPGVDCGCAEGAAEACTPDKVSCTAVPDQADGVEFALAGNVSDMVATPDGALVYVVYQDQSFASVIAVRTDIPDAFGDGCIDGGQAPCEVARVGLTFDCSNGVDDDGDGLVDQEDPQCFNPIGAESPDGIGRSPVGSCSNGEDDDGDGQVDRDDPNCLWSGDDEEVAPIADAVSACMDGADNDRDGATDYPADDACYGTTGQSEQNIKALGFTSISIDPFGKFIYVVDRANNQVIVVDATRHQLIDVYHAGGQDRRPFASHIGIAIPPSPIVASGRVTRDIVWQAPRPEQCDPQGDCAHAVVRYQYGAFVATDGGQAYDLNALTTYCEVTAPQGERVLRSEEFFYGSPALEASPERHCLTTPALPVNYDAQACDALESCTQCQLGGGTCDPACEDTAALRQACLGDRLASDAGVRLAFNPTLAVKDEERRAGRVRGLGSCDTPSSLTQALRDSADGPVDTSCTSALRPQPVHPDTREEALLAGEFERAQLLQESTILLTGADQLSTSEQAGRDDAENPFDVVALELLAPDDQALVSEAWSVTWEGVIPNTRREDGLLSADEPGVMQVAGLDLCKDGVEPGDRLTILSRPITADQSSSTAPGTVPPGCEAFGAPDERQDYLTWSIAEVRPHTLVLETIAGAEGDKTYTDALPSRECFAQGVTYEIRANDEWTVVGDRSGFLSQKTSLYGSCQPVYGAETPRFNSRVKTGELFTGPYLSFLLREGAVAPSRDDQELVYRFGIERNYRPDATRTTTLLPTDMLLADGLPGGPWLLIADPASNFIFFRDLSRPKGDGAFLLQ